jgi:hypothetical protein
MPISVRRSSVRIEGGNAVDGLRRFEGSSHIIPPSDETPPAEQLIINYQLTTCTQRRFPVGSRDAKIQQFQTVGLEA